MTTSNSAGDEESTPTVIAECANCGDEHPLGDRTLGQTTTCCPHCGDTSYSTRSEGKSVIKPDNERIDDVVRDVEGVGAKTRENIKNSFPSFYDFEGADVDTLTQIDGVGEGIAERIVERTH